MLNTVPTTLKNIFTVFIIFCGWCKYFRNKYRLFLCRFGSLQSS